MVAEWPEGFERAYVATSLGRLHVVAAGAGPALVLLASAGRSSRMYRGLMERLQDRFRVFAFDTPGFGSSDPLAEGTTIEALAGAFLDAMTALGRDRFTLYGLHTGNKIGTAMAVAAPQRFERLVLVGQSHSLIPDQAARNGTIGDLVADKIAPPTGAAADAAAWAAIYRTLAEEWWSADVTDAGFSEEARRVAHAKALDALQSAGTPALYAANFAYDLGRDLARLTVPTLLIEVATPHEDAAIGRQAAAVLALVPHASVATIEEPAGETLTLEHRADDLAALVRDAR